MKEPSNALSNYLSIAGPPVVLSAEQKKESALRVATEIAGRWTKDGEVFIPAIEPGMVELDDAIKPVWQRKGYRSEAEEEFAKYDFPDWPWERWSHFLNSTMRHRQLIFDRVGSNLMKGAPVPESLRIIAGAHLMGHIQPLRQPPKKKTQIHRNTLISGVARKVSEQFGVPIGASKATFQKHANAPLCGASFAAAGLFAWGVVVTCQRANDVCFVRDLPIERAQEAGVFTSGITLVADALMGKPSGLEDRISLARAYLTRST